MSTRRKDMSSAMTIVAALCLGTGPSTGATAEAHAWPQFHGPSRDGNAPAESLPAIRAGTPIEVATRWRVPLGAGFGGPAVRDGELFILDETKSGRMALRCLTLDAGKDAWRFEYAAGKKNVSPAGPRTTPAVTAGHVFTVDQYGMAYGIDRRTHQPAWKIDLLKEYNAKDPKWGVSHSPVFHEGKAILFPQGEKAGLVALHAESGKELWRLPKTQSTNLAGWCASYATPVVARIGGEDQVVFVAAQTESERNGCVAGVSLADGSLRWTYDGWQCPLPIAAPLVLSGDRVFVTGAYGAGSALLRVLHRAGTWSVEKVFSTIECGSQIQQPLLHGSHLYIMSNGKEKPCRARQKPVEEGRADTGSTTARLATGTPPDAGVRGAETQRDGGIAVSSA